MKQNSFWFVEENEDKMYALCEPCGIKLQKGWFWEGNKLGYGDYDLFCKNCKNVIHLREKNADKVNNKN
jgi:hypothetical protein